MKLSVEWTDAEGTRAVLRDGRLSLYGTPSMRREDGAIAIGIDVPDDIGILGLSPSECRDLTAAVLESRADFDHFTLDAALTKLRLIEQIGGDDAGE